MNKAEKAIEGKDNRVPISVRPNPSQRAKIDAAMAVDNETKTAAWVLRAALSHIDDHPERYSHKG